MSQVGKLYKFYLRKIWQKNWFRIIVFTLLIGVVWWFVVPWAGLQLLKSTANRGSEVSESQTREREKEERFSEVVKNSLKDRTWALDRVKIRKLLDDEQEWEKWAKKYLKTEKETNWKIFKWGLRMVDSGTYLGVMSFPFNSDNAFFCSQTEGYDKGKAFWKMLFDISWWNLTGLVVLYWFIFEVFDNTFFSSRREGEDAIVLTTTPGVKRSDVIWGKILAFLTFYFLINIVIFLIPFGIYYFWLASEAYFPWFALLALITIIVGPLLYFGLIFVPYLFFGSLTGQKWIFSTLIAFFPMLWGALKLITSASWPHTVEKTFFDPVWFIIISLVCGIFFLTLYYLRYQEEDLN